MKDERKTKKQLVAELTELRQHLTEATQRLGELEASEARLKQVEDELRLYSEKLKDLVDDKTRILRESGENFRALADNAGDGIFISVGEGTHVYANRQAAEMTGYSVAELLNVTVEDLMSSDERQRAVTRYRKRLAGENVPNRYETVILKKDGASVPVELTAARTVWHAQPAVMAVMRDITERVRSEATRARAEEALRESEAKFRTLAEQSPNMIFINKRGRVVYANQHCEKVTGYKREAFYAPDFDFMDLVSPEDRDLISTGFARHMKGEEVEPYEYRLLTKEGEPVDVIITTKLIDYEGEAAIFGIVTDITERKKAEVALEQYAERLRTLHEIDQAILEARSPDAIAQAVLQRMQKLVLCQHASVAVFNPGAHTATILATDPITEVGLDPGTQISLEPFGDIVESLRKGEGYVLDDLLTFPHPPPIVQAQQEAGVRAFACVPLIAQNELIGALSLSAETPGCFGREQIEIVREAANQVAIVIQQARLHAQVQRHADELEERVTERTAELEQRTMQLQTAAEVARDATTAHDLDSLLERAVNLVRERFGFYHAGIFLVDAQGEYAVLRAATGEAGRQMIESGHKLKVGEVGIVGYAIGSGKPHIALDVGGDAVHFKNPFLPDTRSEMTLPLQVGGRVIGALDVQSNREAAFGEDDVATLQIMADQLAVAIGRTRLFEQMRVALEERLHTVVSSTPVILFAMDRDGVITLAEGKGLQSLGLKPDALVGKSAFDVYRGFPDVLSNVRRALAGEAVAQLIDIGGVLFEGQYTPLLDERGEITGIMGISVDVTERVHLEAQVHQQERLAAVGQLAGGIAHDFNNYLTTIMLYAQILLSAPKLPPDMAPNAQTILDESRGAARLVQQILDFSRRSMMEALPVDLVSLVEEVAGILRRTLPENIHLLIEVGTDDLVVNADPTRIQQVVMNLALNARDAMPEGGELHIKLSRVRTGSGKRPSAVEVLPPDMPDGKWVCMTISDTGTGMTEEVQSHLFEPFFTTKGTQGTGLGLAQVHGIVKQHEGHIGVKSGAGEGTTFCIYLPAHEVEKKAVVEAAPALPAGKGETILLVEDEERVREAIHEMLEMLGYQVLIAANGLEALEAYQSAAKVDLVLTDVVMPEMGGVELVQELQRKDPGLKALALTGYALEKDLSHAAGISEVVPKPVEMHVLVEAIRWVLARDAR
jgi:PAS domain S-box-containing protein